ncbi:acyl-CoA dehydrogenase [Kribbia dieselivorans]|uniref:acyl-CoA dehydrogenase n=1 Tax=Kribbia dieselivorans TaxID=331526 RepID=UPI000837D8AF|nr:acyl-CoA dehydrogenase [Kribbia dieselivorans]
MAEDLLSRRDLDFLLNEWLNVAKLTERPRYADHGAETFASILDVSEQVARRHFATHFKTGDAREPSFDGTTVTIIPEVGEALEAFAATGLVSAAFDEEQGGIQLPHVIHRACFMWFQAANIATASFPMLTMANAGLLLAHASEEQVATYVPPMLEGRWSGTMCLSEPEVGSSLADVATRAELQDDGTYRIVGSKMWISGGEHEVTENIVHLVLARVVGDAPGVKGLSLFIVPKHLPQVDGTLGERNDVSLSGLNHKMGYRGIPNTLLAFGDGTHPVDGAPGARGFLIGGRGAGLTYMFHMMNEARIGVGSGAVALGYRGYLTALDYARERRQGRPTAGKDPAAPPVPIIEHADVRRMLLASKSYVEGGLALALYCASLVDEQETAPNEDERIRASRLLDLLTPIVKAWTSQWCLKANDHAIQVLGGAGYTRDHDVEQLYRDNRLNPIHEGTDGIQSIDLLGRKVRLYDGESMRLLADEIRSTVRRAEGTLWADRAAALAIAWERIEEVTVQVWSQRDPELALANSWRYLEAFGHTVLAWLWLDVALATGAQDEPYHRGKRAAAAYFLDHELPHVHPALDVVARLDRTMLDLDPTTL